MATLIYGRTTDNIAATATIVASAADAAYPATNLIDLNPAKPAKLTTPTGNWVFDFTTAKQVDVVALIHHNFQAGLNVRWQGNATDSWGAPTIDQAFTIPAYHEDGFPVNPFLDLTGIGSRTFRFWRLVVVGTNPVICALGEIIILGTKRTLVHNVIWGAEDEEDHPHIEHRTDYGVSTIYSFGTKMRNFRGEIDTTDAGANDFLSLRRGAFGRGLGFLAVPDPAKNDAWFGRLIDPKQTRTYVFLDRNTLPFLFEEISRGLKPTPSAV